MRKISVLFLAVVLLASAIVPSFAAAPTPNPSAAPALIITEVVPNTKSYDKFEYLEVYNASGSALNLYDYALAYSTNVAKDPNKMTPLQAGDPGINSSIGIENPSILELASGEVAVLWAYSSDSVKYDCTLADFKSYWSLKDTVKVALFDARSEDSGRFRLPNNEAERALHIVTSEYTVSPPSGELLVCSGEWSGKSYGGSGVGDDEAVTFTAKTSGDDLRDLISASNVETATPGTITNDQKANLAALKAATTAQTTDTTQESTEPQPPPPTIDTAPITLDKPSDWAQVEVSAAIEAGLIPEGMQFSYTENATRTDFCKLAIELIKVKTGKPIGEVLKEKGVTINTETFLDTLDETILAANALGIVGGVGNQMFAPAGYVTRQDAAAMLMRTAKVFGFTEPNGEAPHFSDKNTFSSYAVEAIAFISACEDKTNGNKVMGGVGENKFDPKGNYTKQQAFLTMIRLFNAID